MSEKVRGAIFNALGDVAGLTVMDAFSGSGAIGIEAISRGAASVVAIDIDKSAAHTTKRNAANLGIQNQLKAVRANIAGWLETQPDQQFDLVVLDPPYDDVRHDILQTAAKRTVVNGVVVLSLPPDSRPDFGDDFTKLLSRSYGDATLWFFRRTAATD